MQERKRPTTCLLINADYRPIKVIGWQRAVILVLEGTSDLVQAYEDFSVRSANSALPLPAVVRLRRFSNFKVRLRFNRQNVLARDGWQCMYCGKTPRLADGRPDVDALTIDHVVPRAQSKAGMVTLPWSKSRVSVTCWENILSCCVPCNSAKADRTPEQAGLRMIRIPAPPSSADVLRMSLSKLKVPSEWEEYL